jgi:Txe/YoeB family toxin of Txe-Axe toxin-antitoxin module
VNGKPVYVSFGDKSIEEDYETLKEGKFEDKRLYEFIERAIKDLKENPTCGIKIPKKIWPAVYIKKFDIANLWKYDLPNGWRLIYTIKTDEIMILSVILEWFDHQDYERRFNY